MEDFRWRSPALLIIFLAGCFHLATIRPGHTWGDDFALYILHARNLATGTNYHETGYIYDQQYSELSPPAYPPLLPLVLTPVYKWFGLNLLAMKAVIVLFFVAFLVVCWVGFRPHLSEPALLLLLVLLSFNPYISSFKDQVLSDIPFLFFVYLALVYLDRAQRHGDEQQHPMTSAVMAGLLMYLACATRTIGVVLVPTLLLSEILRGRRPRAWAWGAAGVCGLLLAMQGFLLRSEGGYLDQLLRNPTDLAGHLVGYARTLSDFWDNGFSLTLRAGTTLLLTGLFLIGFARRFLHERTVYESFAILYGTAVIIWPAFQGGRFLLPLLPILFLGALTGLGQLSVSCPGTIARTAWAGFAMILATSYAGGYRQKDFGPLQEGIAKPESIDCFDHVRETTASNSVVVFRKPRALALFAQRRAAYCPPFPSDRQVWQFLHAIRATHVIVGSHEQEDFREDRAHLEPFLARHPSRFTLEYANRDFRVYRIRDTDEQAASAAGLDATGE